MALVLLIITIAVAAPPRIAFWLWRDGNSARDKVNTTRAMFDSPGGHKERFWIENRCASSGAGDGRVGATVCTGRQQRAGHEIRQRLCLDVFK